MVRLARFDSHSQASKLFLTIGSMRIHIYVQLSLLMVLVVSCKAQNYSAQYTTISMIGLVPSERVELEDWLSVDTVNLKSNKNMVVVGSMDFISNGEFSYIVSTTRKSNIGGNTSEVERVLLDYKNKMIYFLDAGKSFECIDFNLEISEGASDESTYKVFMNKGENEAHITFEKNVPSELKSKLISEDLVHGIKEIWSNNQRITLIRFEEVEDFDFKSLEKEAKRSCTLQSQKMDLIFPM